MFCIFEPTQKYKYTFKVPQYEARLVSVTGSLKIASIRRKHAHMGHNLNSLKGVL